MHGDIAGTVTPRGFKVDVKGEGLKANMDIVILGAKQVIEIQFIDSSLIGLTLILEKGLIPLAQISSRLVVSG